MPTDTSGQLLHLRPGTTAGSPVPRSGDWAKSGWADTWRSGQLTPLQQAQQILGEVRRRLTRLARLEQDWDSYGGLPPAALAFASASNLVFEVADRYGALYGRGIRPYAVVPMSDGGVQLEWRSPQVEIEVEVGPSGQLNYLLIDGTGESRRFTEADDVDEATILRLVERVVSAAEHE